MKGFGQTLLKVSVVAGIVLAGVVTAACNVTTEGYDPNRNLRARTDIGNTIRVPNTAQAPAPHPAVSEPGKLVGPDPAGGQGGSGGGGGGDGGGGGH